MPIQKHGGWGGENLLVQILLNHIGLHSVAVRILDPPGFWNFLFHGKVTFSCLNTLQFWEHGGNLQIQIHIQDLIPEFTKSEPCRG